MIALGFLAAATPAAHAETRTLKLYFIHTKERAEITYKRNGRYIQSGLQEINRFLRDWRRNEPTKMSPQLLDLMWEVYRATRARDYIHVVSAYRSPQTNSMLRSRSGGVAKKSQHMLGMAIDFYIPGVKLSSLRAAALKYEAGGVGYYPRSGSPFVHLDVGGVRHWPRMSRKELLALFPDGKTIHVPTDGKPLPGYKQALASYEARKRSGGSIQVASDSGGRRGGGGLLAALFGGGADEEEDNADSVAAPARKPARAQPAPVQVARAAPAPAAPQPQAPAETPATILAALPQRDLPVPRSAPRPDVAVGQPLPFEVKPVEQAPVLAEKTPEETATAVLVATNVPIPTRRPNYTPPPAAVPDEPTRDATRDALVQMASAETGAPDAIAGVLANAQNDAEEPVGTAAYLPVPSRRPMDAATRVAMTKEAEATEFRLAALPQPRPGQEAPAETISTPATADLQPRGEPVSASPRLALLASANANPAKAVTGSARSTGKSAKPGPKDVSPEAQPVVVAATLGTKSRAFSRHSMLTEAAHGTHPPAFDSEFVRSPKTVYTTGFEQNLAVADATRFTGKAVNFLSMARFRTN
ncbi:DUF882 domain-containing protein [Nitratireductor soli]|uniref:DUF882 domain-containing protein n=1 Tax=Nitratireductor soli TaxID=1670619 RepID=UPI00065E6916|nr:DUF882 domain-containing protein [Nitratireductor soli]